MPQVGWRDPASGIERPFEDWLAEAEAYGSAIELPYEVLFGIAKQLDKSDRPDGITVTQLNGCARAVHLEKLHDYYTEPLENYAAFRGTLAHGLIEKFKPAGAVIEERYYRRYKALDISGQVDSWRIMNVPDEVSREWHEWLRHVEHVEAGVSAEACEVGEYDICPGRTQPVLPKGARLLIRDWKTKHDVPSYQYLANRYQNQGNVYAWLLRWPDPATLDVEFVFISMEGVKVQSLMNGGTYRNGRAKPEQIWTDDHLAKFFDDRLVTLAASKQLDRPLPYDRVPVEDLWQCSWCPARELCYRMAADEARKAFAKGETVDRLPPRADTPVRKR